MVICRYYIHGNCRFGDRCWNEHPREGGGSRLDYRNDNYNSRYSYTPQKPRISHQYGNSQQWAESTPRSSGHVFSNHQKNPSGFDANRFHSIGETPAKQKFTFQINNPFEQLKNINSKPAIHSSELDHLTPQEIIEVISNEVGQWEVNKQWPFSCFAYERGGLCLPGFKDVSFEELRWEGYEAKKNGTFTTYEEHVKDMYSDWKNKVLQLKHPDASVNQSLIEFINNKKNLILSASPPFPTGFLRVSTIDSIPSGFTILPQNIPTSTAVTVHISPYDNAISNKFNFGNSEFIVPPSSNTIPNVGNQPITNFFSTVNKNLDSKQGIFQRNNTEVSTVFGGLSMTGTTGESNSVLSTNLVNSAVSNSNLGHSCLYTSLNEITSAEKQQFEAQCFSLGLIPSRPPPKEMI